MSHSSSNHGHAEEETKGEGIRKETCNAREEELGWSMLMQMMWRKELNLEADQFINANANLDTGGKDLEDEEEVLDEELEEGDYSTDG